MREYRVNFGNGTVHYPSGLGVSEFESCISFIEEYGDGHTFLEQRDFDTGDWYASKRVKGSFRHTVQRR